MATTDVDLTRRLARLRAEFDESFAQPARAPDGAYVELLALSVADRRYVIRVADIAGTHVDKPITAVPSSSSDLVGLAAFRGSLVAVFDLARLLGLNQTGSSRWVVQARGEAIGFAFESFLGHLRLPAQAVEPKVGGASNERGRLAAHIEGVPHPLIELSDVVSRVKSRISTARET